MMSQNFMLQELFPAVAGDLFSRGIGINVLLSLVDQNGHRRRLREGPELLLALPQGLLGLFAPGDVLHDAAIPFENPSLSKMGMALSFHPDHVAVPVDVPAFEVRDPFSLRELTRQDFPDTLVTPPGS